MKGVQQPRQERRCFSEPGILLPVSKNSHQNVIFHKKWHCHCAKSNTSSNIYLQWEIIGTSSCVFWTTWILNSYHLCKSSKTSEWSSNWIALVMKQSPARIPEAPLRLFFHLYILLSKLSSQFQSKRDESAVSICCRKRPWTSVKSLNVILWEHQLNASDVTVSCFSTGSFTLAQMSLRMWRCGSFIKRFHGSLLQLSNRKLEWWLRWFHLIKAPPVWFIA